MKLDKKTVVPELLRWLIKPRPRLRIPRKEAAGNGDHALRRPPPPPLYGFDFQSSYSYFASLYFFFQALPNQQTVDYPNFKLVIVGDGGTGKLLIESHDFFPE